MRIHSPHLSQSSPPFPLFFPPPPLFSPHRGNITASTAASAAASFIYFAHKRNQPQSYVFLFYTNTLTFYYNGRSDPTQTGLKRSESSADGGRGGEEHFFLDWAKENVFLFLLLRVFLYRISILV